MKVSDKMKNRKGFTLVELLAVITILGIIIMIATVSVTSILNKNDKKNVSNDGSKLAEAAKIYYQDQGYTGDKKITLANLKSSGYIKDTKLTAGCIDIKITKNGTTNLGGKTVDKYNTTITWYVSDGKYYSTGTSIDSASIGNISSTTTTSKINNCQI